GSGAAADTGIDPSEAGDLALEAGKGAPVTNASGDVPRLKVEKRSVIHKDDGSPDVEIDDNGIVVNGGPGKTKGIRDVTPRGAEPDNISGDGSLANPFRVRNPKDPTIKSKIKVGDHFI